LNQSNSVWIIHQKFKTDFIGAYYEQFFSNASILHYHYHNSNKRRIIFSRDVCWFLLLLFLK